MNTWKIKRCRRRNHLYVKILERLSGVNAEATFTLKEPNLGIEWILGRLSSLDAETTFTSKKAQSWDGKIPGRWSSVDAETTFTLKEPNLGMGWILGRQSGLDAETTFTSKKLNLGMGITCKTKRCRRRDRIYNEIAMTQDEGILASKKTL